MSAALSSFLPTVLRNATACPDFTAEQAVLDAAIAFCAASRAWRMIDDHALTEGWSGPIPISLGEGQALHSIERAWFDGKKLDPKPFSDYPQDGDIQGTPRFFSQAERGSLLVWGEGQAGPLRLSLFLKPSNDAEAVPDFLFEDHREDIAAGALADLLMTPDVAWSDPNRATYYGAKFKAACDAAFAASIRGQQRAPARSRSRFV